MCDTSEFLFCKDEPIPKTENPATEMVSELFNIIKVMVFSGSAVVCKNSSTLDSYMRMVRSFDHLRDFFLNATKVREQFSKWSEFINKPDASNNELQELENLSGVDRSSLFLLWLFDHYGLISLEPTTRFLPLISGDTVRIGSLIPWNASQLVCDMWDKFQRPRVSAYNPNMLEELLAKSSRDSNSEDTIYTTSLACLLPESPRPKGSNLANFLNHCLREQRLPITVRTGSRPLLYCNKLLERCTVVIALELVMPKYSMFSILRTLCPHYIPIVVRNYRRMSIDGCIPGIQLRPDRVLCPELKEFLAKNHCKSLSSPICHYEIQSYVKTFRAQFENDPLFAETLRLDDKLGALKAPCQTQGNDHSTSETKLEGQSASAESDAESQSTSAENQSTSAESQSTSAKNQSTSAESNQSASAEVDTCKCGVKGGKSDEKKETSSGQSKDQRTSVVEKTATESTGSSEKASDDKESPVSSAKADTTQSEHPVDSIDCIQAAENTESVASQPSLNQDSPEPESKEPASAEAKNSKRSRNYDFFFADPDSGWRYEIKLGKTTKCRRVRHRASAATAIAADD